MFKRNAATAFVSLCLLLIQQYKKMSLLKVIPNIFYEDIQVGLGLFVDGLGFKTVYTSEEGEPFYIIERDGVVLHLSQNAVLAKEHRPEIRIATDDIDSVYKEIKDGKPELLHPNLNKLLYNHGV